MTSSVSKRLNLNFGKSKSKKKQQGAGAAKDELDLSFNRKFAVSRSDVADSLEQQHDVTSLAEDVRLLSGLLADLKNVADRTELSSAERRMSAHEKLGKVLSELRRILQRFSTLNTAEVLSASATLINNVKNDSFDNDKEEFLRSLDHLAHSFTTSISEYLMSDLELPANVGKTKLSEVDSCEFDALNSGSEVSHHLTQELDDKLASMDNGIDVALQWAKVWSKYTKDIVNYIEKRTQLESDYAKGLQKLSQAVKQTITDDLLLPLQSIYLTALEHDAQFSSVCIATGNLIHKEKFIEPLQALRSEHEKTRKALKENWTREVRRLQDIVSTMKKARIMYINRQQDYEKAREVNRNEQDSNRLERRKKLEDEAMHKAIEAETTYKACVVEANSAQADLGQAKAAILSQIRQLILHCDSSLRALSTSYFQLQNNLTAGLPSQFEALLDSSQHYHVGSCYADYVTTLQPTMHGHTQFVFEPFSSSESSKCYVRKPSTQSSGSGSSDPLPEDSPVNSPGYSSKIKLWAHSGALSSDTDSLSSSKSRESSPAASPFNSRGFSGSNSFCDLVDCEQDGSAPDVSSFGGVCLSTIAQTHLFRKLRSPSRCRQCDSYVYFHGAECAKCGISVHRRCLETLSWECGHKPPARSMTTFGVDFAIHVAQTGLQIPLVVQKCCQEIDQRGLSSKGIYRVSGVKSRVEKLCQNFESGNDIDLSEHQANVIASVLKLYLRQLPEPLCTFQLYPDLIAVVKEDVAEDVLVCRLKTLLMRLPRCNFTTLAFIMHHLHRVCAEEELNQMSASNLGIVFGPTLLRPQEGAASLSSLMDTPLQSRIIQLLVQHVQFILGDDPMPHNQRQVLRSDEKWPVASSAHNLPEIVNNSSPSKQNIEPLPPTAKVIAEVLPSKDISPSPAVNTQVLPRCQQLGVLKGCSTTTGCDATITAGFSAPRPQLAPGESSGVTAPVFDFAEQRDPRQPEFV